MGMFDYVRCKYPLPIDGAEAIEWQTKDTPSQYMDRYEIREDGTLWYEEWDVMAGAICLDKYTGEIRFYTYQNNELWIEFSAYFVAGKLQSMTQIFTERT